MKQIVFVITILLSSMGFARQGQESGGAYEEYNQATLDEILAQRDFLLKYILISLPQNVIDQAFPVKKINKGEMISMLMNIKFNLECERSRLDENNKRRSLIMDYGPRGKSTYEAPECEQYSGKPWIEVLKRFYDKVDEKKITSFKIAEYLLHESLHQFGYATEKESWDATHQLISLSKGHVKCASLKKDFSEYNCAYESVLDVKAITELMTRVLVNNSPEAADFILAQDSDVYLVFKKNYGAPVSITIHKKDQVIDLDIKSRKCFAVGSGVRCLYQESFDSKAPDRTLYNWPYLDLYWWIEPSSAGILFTNIETDITHHKNYSVSNGATMTNGIRLGILTPK